MTPPKDDNAQQLFDILWLSLVFLSLVVMIIMPDFTRNIVSFILGILSAVIVLKIHDRLSRYPQKLFKTKFQTTADYESPILADYGKLLILSIGVHKLFFFIDTKKLCQDIPRIGIRPQIGKPWYKRWFRSYNKSTQDISLGNRTNPPIRIKSIKDVTLRSNENFNGDEDDKSCGRWGFYKPSLQIIPDMKHIYEAEIEALKQWRGYIDFRIDTKDYMRVAHHPCEIR